MTSCDDQIHFLILPVNMTHRLLIVLSIATLISIENVRGQCTDCTRDQGCCMGLMRGQWSCCAGIGSNLNNQQTTPWNFNLQISYDVYVWNCGSSTVDPLQQYTNVSCILDGRWSLNQLTFQLRSVPSNDMKTIIGKYTMKNKQSEKIAFQADSQWALTLPVDSNAKPGIYDEIEFNYAGFNYTYYFGYGPYPHCPRC
ncbi:unnamed protein product [Rotaria socialis]|uniref:Uncharacterized protein n=1 Tax=Rotaria socialis TaxID=392032 RepID=A0A820RA46_9BILA|nr:unnamed protein product [Rotaria socialis]CAF4432571.1 unnamed protein product [Rotaria socialis]